MAITISAILLTGILVAALASTGIGFGVVLAIGIISVGIKMYKEMQEAKLNTLLKEENDQVRLVSNSPTPASATPQRALSASNHSFFSSTATASPRSLEQTVDKVASPLPDADVDENTGLLSTATP